LPLKTPGDEAKAEERRACDYHEEDLRALKSPRALLAEFSARPHAPAPTLDAHAAFGTKIWLVHGEVSIGQRRPAWPPVRSSRLRSVTQLF